jgi:ribonuclease E
MSAVEPVPDATTPVSSSESAEVAPVLATSAAPPDSAATEGPVWPADTATPEATSAQAPDSAETTVEETPAAEAPSAADAPDELTAEAVTAQAEETSAAAEDASPAVVDDVVPAVPAPEGEVEVPGAVEAGAAGVIIAEAAAPAGADDPAASSGAWPEPPTPWADTGAIAAVGAAVGATSGATETPQVATLDETLATDTATPDVGDLPTAVNAQQTETPQVDAVPPPVPEEPPAYAPPPPTPVYATPPSPSPGYAAALQPAASAYVAPQARPVNTTPVIVEAILAFFGIYGVGWLIAGETTIGIVLLIAGFVWDAIFVAAAFTVIGLCCVVPLQLIFVALSAFQLNNRLRMRA